MTTATKAKEPMPPDMEHRQTRAGLQQKLRDRDKIKAELDAAAVRLKEARRAVETFERPRGFVDNPLRDWEFKATAFNDLSNKIPQALQNNCRDAGLRGEFSDAKSLKRDTVREQNAARITSEAAVQSLAELRTRLTKGDDLSPRSHGEAEFRGDADPAELPAIPSSG